MQELNPKLKLLIDNFFISFNGQNVFCQVNDTECRYVFHNDYFDIQDIIINHKKALGKSILEFLNGFKHHYHDDYLIEYNSLYTNVMQTRQRKSFFAYSCNNDKQEFIRLVNVFPLISADGELLGTYTLSWFANPLNFLNYFQNNFCTPRGKLPPSEKDFQPLQLTKREHQVLFLLLYNFSQYEIADFLHIARGTVQKIINEKLCDKLKINPPQVTELLDEARKIGLQYYFPPSLLGYRIVELYNDETFLRCLADKITKPE